MTVTTRMGGPRARLATLLALPVILLAVAACAPGAGGDTGSVDSAQSVEGGAEEVTSEKSEMTQWMLDYAACMRGEGIDMPDPDSTERGKATSGLGPGEDQDAAAAAGEKCMAEVGEMPPPSAQDKAEADEAMLEWATEASECYRENGYDMPDPTAVEEIQFPEDASAEVVQQCGGVAPARVQE